MATLARLFFLVTLLLAFTPQAWGQSAGADSSSSAAEAETPPDPLAPPKKKGAKAEKKKDAATAPASESSGASSAATEPASPAASSSDASPSPAASDGSASEAPASDAPAADAPAADAPAAKAPAADAPAADAPASDAPTAAEDEVEGGGFQVYGTTTEGEEAEEEEEDVLVNEEVVQVQTAPDPREADQEAEDVQKGFIKGELAAIGRIDLLSKYHRAGLRLGATSFNKEVYARIDPVLELNYPDTGLSLGFSAPLHFYLADMDQPIDDVFDKAGALRTQDWDSPTDFLQLISHVTYGGKEHELFINLSQVDSVTVGHGSVMRRYVSNLDVNRHRLGAEVDAYNEYGGFELHANDVAGPEVIGALAFIKPGRLLGEDRPLKRLSLGLHYTADIAAPLQLACSTRTTLECDEARGRGYFSTTGEDHQPGIVSTDQIHFVGVDVEFKPIRTGNADLKPYLDYTQMFYHGGGLTLGVLGRFNLGEKRNSAFRIRAEGRRFDADYIPSYFDLMYEVDRYVSVAAINAGKPAQTKLSYLKSFQDGVLNGTEETRYGFYLEATYQLRNWFALTGAWEQSTADASKSMLLHLELPASKWFTLFFTYIKRNFEEFDSAPFDFQRTDSRLGDSDYGMVSDEMFFWAFRIKLLPILAINWRAQKSFEVRDDKYQQVFHFTANVELGYEF